MLDLPRMNVGREQGTQAKVFAECCLWFVRAKLWRVKSRKTCLQATCWSLLTDLHQGAMPTAHRASNLPNQRRMDAEMLASTRRKYFRKRSWVQMLLILRRMAQKTKARSAGGQAQGPNA